jgi:hypothetical protein
VGEEFGHELLGFVIVEDVGSAAAEEDFIK